MVMHPLGLQHSPHVSIQMRRSEQIVVAIERQIVAAGLTQDRFDTRAVRGANVPVKRNSEQEESTQ